MKNSCFLLFKIQFLSLFGINKFRYSKDRMEKRKMMIFTIMMIPLILVLLSYSFGLSYAYAYLGLTDILPSLMLVVCSILVLFTTILKSNGVLFSLKDYDMIMSLPIKTASIVCSRFMTMYVLNFLFCSAVLIPSTIVYAIFKIPSALFYVMFVISLFSIPLFPMALASIIGGLITLISIRFRHKNMVSIILSITFCILFLFYSFQANNINSKQFSQFSTDLLNSIYKLYPIAQLYQNAINNGDLLSFVLFTLISIGTFLFFVVMVSHYYKQIHTLLFTHQTKGNYKIGTLKSSSPFVSLYKKELRRYFSSNVYVLNTSIGVILLFFVSLAIFVLGPDKIGALMEIPKQQMTIPYQKIIPLIVSAFVVMSSTTASSISLEGKNMWILKSVPVENKTIYFSKIAVNLTILLPITLISSFLLALRLQTGFLETLLLFFVPSVYTFFIAQIGLLLNLKFSNFEWTNEVTVIKQSAAVLITILIGFLLIAISGGLVFLFQLENANYTLLLFALVIFALTFLMNRYTNTISIAK